AHHDYAWDATARALDVAYAAFVRRRGELADMAAELAAFRARSARWLPADAPERDAFAQFVVHAQHADVRAEAGLRLYGDLAIGMAPEDAAAYRQLFLSAHVMGAPPSRTNPEGQEWGYPVFDPRARADVLAFVRARIGKMVDEYDGIRLDHPHGLVDPWVYRPEIGVGRGSRLHSSPDVAELAGFAIARPEQLDRARPRHDDNWVRDLDDDQVARYADIVDCIMD